jgi:uncharacterized repeat protein (TIGR03803 family)
MQGERKADTEGQDNSATKSKNKQGADMRSERREINHRGRRRATLETEWWRRFGALCLQLCLILAATAMVSLAQNEQDHKNEVKFTTLVNFDGTNGETSNATLVQGRDGNLYGTTVNGGANTTCFFGACGGTAFKVTPSGTLTTLYNFCSEANCADGANPDGGDLPATLVLGNDGNLYGVTEFGGTGAGCTIAAGCGTFFKITPSGTLTTIYNWCSQPNCADGTARGGGSFIQATDGNFYGVTILGGTGFDGTIFKLTPTGSLTTLHTFCFLCPDGAIPSGLIQATDGNLYGTTLGGGNGFNAGTVFKITPGGALTTLYNFCSQRPGCADGAAPVGLIQATDGNFYGSASSGAIGGGTVFKITPSGTLTTLYTFCSQPNCADGASPTSLIQATDGNLYGATTNGGNIAPCSGAFPPGCGTLFKITPSGMLTTLHIFDVTDGVFPNGLFQATDGTLYGTTPFGGLSNSSCFGPGCGTLFSLAVGLRPFVETLPTAGTVGEAVTILGNDLSDATHVFFNNRQAEFTVVSNSEIQTSVPAGATTGFVTVNRHGPRLKSNVSFRVLP